MVWFSNNMLVFAPLFSSRNLVCSGPLSPSFLIDKILWLLAMIIRLQSQNSPGLALLFTYPCLPPIQIPNSSDQNSLGKRLKSSFVCVHACVHASTQSLSSWDLSRIQRPVHSTVWTQPWGEEGTSQNSRGCSANLRGICLIVVLCTLPYTQYPQPLLSLSFSFFYPPSHSALKTTESHFICLGECSQNASFWIGPFIW